MQVRPKIGANVLETLTTGMYTNPLDTIREFVQNGSDSIRAAERQGILSVGDGRITVEIEKRKHRLVVRDNGIGVPENEIEARLINIGMSDKSIIQDAGFRGIGRLAGIAYCDNFIFRTSAKGEKLATKIKINSKFIREATRPARASKAEAQEIMSENTKIETEAAKSEDHFFEVIMEGISVGTTTFLDWNGLESYLAQVAPVDFDAQTFKFAKTIKKWAEDQKHPVPTISLVVKDVDNNIEREVFKPYKAKYQIRKSKNKQDDMDVSIHGIEFFPKNLSPDSTFWLWYGECDLLGQIVDPAAGLRVRKGNIELGGANIAADLFEQISKSNRRFNSYFVGEIHVLTVDAIPNARRDGFEDLDAWPEIRGEIKGFLHNLCELVRQASKDRNLPTNIITSATKKILNQVENKIEEGLVSENERDNLVCDVDKQLKKIKGAIKQRKTANDGNKLIRAAEELEEVRNELVKTKSYVEKRKDLDLSMKQKVVLQEVLEVIYEELSNDSCKKNRECYQRLKEAVLAKYKNT